MKQALVVLTVIALALGLFGCESIGEQVSEEIAGGAIGGDVEVDDNSMTIETDDGAVTIEGDTGEIPEGFPTDFPIYDNAEIDSTSSISGDADVSYYINLISDDDVATIYDWYKAEFESEDWTITGDIMMSGDGDDSAMLSTEKDKMKGTVTITKSDRGTEIGIILVDEQ